jgi:ParD-like antitoxin of type II bacterial toxin-antitoxin system
MVSAPTRIDDDLFEAAQHTGPLMSRSAAQQVNHWARIGRALETAKSVSHRKVIEVLAGSCDYDELSDEEQAIIRAEWSERVETTRNDLNLAEEFAAAGRPYVELDADGNVVRRDPAQATTTG